jgi:hypothetical protein
MNKYFEIIPYPGPENEYFIGVDPYGYDGRVATCFVMKRDYPNTTIVAMYHGRGNEIFKKQVQNYINQFQINSSCIRIFDK